MCKEVLQDGTREFADTHLPGAGPVEEDDTEVGNIFGKQVNVPMFDLSGSIAAHVMIVHSTVLSYIHLDDAKLFRKSQRCKREKHSLQGASMVPLIATTFGKLSNGSEKRFPGCSFCCLLYRCS
jgi:hypothetical protein